MMLSMIVAECHCVSSMIVVDDGDGEDFDDAAVVDDDDGYSKKY